MIKIDKTYLSMLILLIIGIIIGTIWFFSYKENMILNTITIISLGISLGYIGTIHLMNN